MDVHPKQKLTTPGSFNSYQLVRPPIDTVSSDLYPPPIQGSSQTNHENLAIVNDCLITRNNTFNNKKGKTTFQPFEPNGYYNKVCMTNEKHCQRVHSDVSEEDTRTYVKGDALACLAKMKQNVNKINDPICEKLLDDEFSIDDNEYDDDEQYYSGCSAGYMKGDHNLNGSKPNSALSYVSADQWRHLKSTGLTSVPSSVVSPLPICDNNSKGLGYDDNDDECIATVSCVKNEKVGVDHCYRDIVDHSEQKQVMQNVDFLPGGGYHYSKSFSNVAVKPQGEPLLPDSSKLMLQNLTRNMVGNAAPFFEALEYNPHCPTDEAIILSILEDEMALLDIDKDKEKLKSNCYTLGT
ncbi:unnamed protein product [Ambrosiozyma monospora]|uniref:Unnamed protein product n=1 Tax=Ambrosiozyma monospora TaxID=43982 RepID=A0A9W7DIF6_AMBMO|nr:unnamed protein product [Ambrosiozyma monospora]